MELISDNPIKDINSDLLDRKNSAENFAKHIFSFNYKEGLVVGICGEWGSGKTSYINLMKPELQQKAIVVDFNPWMFSDSYNLVSLFFTEMAAQIKDYDRNSNLIKALDNFGNFFSSLRAVPLVGAYIGTLGGLLSTYAKKKKEDNSLQKQRSNLVKELEKIEKPIVVILDDIDRLSSDELQSILKLVRVTGNFPNIIYLLSFDKDRVIKTLNDSTMDGEAYLEKIIQIPFDIPKVSRELLEKHLFSSLNDILGDVKFDSYRWSQAYLDIIKPTIKNIRDVRRYIASLSCTYTQIGNFINPIDLLVIETIRVFHPKTFQKIFSLRDYLTKFDGGEYTKQKLKEFIKEDEINKSLLNILFNIHSTSSLDISLDSNENNSLREKRISNIILLSFYFEQVENNEFKDIILSQNLWPYMSSELFRIKLSEINGERLKYVVNNLSDYEIYFTEETALNSIPTLYDNLPRVTEREDDVLELDTDFIWSRLVYRLLRQTPNNHRYNVVSKLMESCNLYGQYEIMGIIGHRKNRGHQLVSKEEATSFENTLINNVNKSSIDELSNTHNLSHILYFIVSTGNILKNEILNSEKIFLSVLASSVSEIRRRIGMNPATIEKILKWDILVKIYNNEELLNKKIENIEKEPALSEIDYIKLAIKYKNGYRHKFSVYGDDDN